MSLAPERRRALHAALAADPDWQALLRHFDLSDGFSFLVLLVDSRENAELCRENLAAYLSEIGAGRIERIPIESPDDFLDLPNLLRHPELDSNIATLWVEAVATEGDPQFEAWRRAWRGCFAHLNPIRNIMQREIPCAVIFVGAPWVQAAIRESAPDLWSIRTTVTRVTPRAEARLITEPPRLEERRGAQAENAPDPEYALKQAEALRGKPGKEPELARLLLRAAQGFVARHKPQMAIIALQEAEKLQAASNSGPVRARILAALGGAYQRILDWDRAEACFNEALNLDHAAGREEEEADDHAGLGFLYRARDRYTPAELHLRRALEILRERFGQDDPRVAAALTNLARVLRETGRLDEAESELRRALSIAEARFGAESALVGSVLANLGLVLEDQGRLTEAEPLLRRALEIDERVHGPDDPQVARDLNNLGALLRQTNRNSEAESLFRRALAIDENRFGPGDSEVGADLANLATFLTQTGQYIEAEQVGRRALGIFENFLGPLDPRVAIMLANLAFILHLIDRSPEGEALSWRALEILREFERQTGSKQRTFETVLNIYRLIASRLGRSEDQIAERLRQLDVPADSSTVPDSSTHL
jgi:tetratricopeptide (TPR) repeat protein